MTTIVTVKTHSWPVDVTITDRYARVLHTETVTVEPGSERQFAIHDSRAIAFHELPLPPADAG